MKWGWAFMKMLYIFFHCNSIPGYGITINFYTCYGRILIITMIVDWLVIIWRWTWVVIMIMPIDSRCSLLIDYDEKHDWWFSDDSWSWLIMIMITKSVIIPAVSGLYRPTGLLYMVNYRYWDSNPSDIAAYHDGVDGTFVMVVQIMHRIPHSFKKKNKQ